MKKLIKTIIAIMILLGVLAYLGAITINFSRIKQLITSGCRSSKQIYKKHSPAIKKYSNKGAQKVVELTAEK